MNKWGYLSNLDMGDMGLWGYPDICWQPLSIPTLSVSSMCISYIGDGVILLYRGFSPLDTQPESFMDIVKDKVDSIGYQRQRSRER